MTDDVTEPVSRFFTSLSLRDFSSARAQWSDSGIWHLHGHHELVGDYEADAYIALLEQWFGDHPDYVAVGFSMQPFGTDVVVAHLETEHGPFPGTATGLMIFRGADRRIAEGWAIPTFAGGEHPF